MYLDITALISFDFLKCTYITHIHIFMYTLRSIRLFPIQDGLSDLSGTLQGSWRRGSSQTISRKHEHFCRWDNANTSRYSAWQSKYSFVFYLESSWSERTGIQAQSKKRWKHSSVYSVEKVYILHCSVNTHKTGSARFDPVLILLRLCSYPCTGWLLAGCLCHTDLTRTETFPKKSIS